MGGKEPYRDDFYSEVRKRRYDGWVNNTQWQGQPDPTEPRFVVSSSGSGLYTALCGQVDVIEIE